MARSILQTMINTIRETDKRSPGYDDAVATLTQELMGLLAELVMRTYYESQSKPAYLVRSTHNLGDQ